MIGRVCVAVLALSFVGPGLARAEKRPHPPPASELKRKADAYMERDQYAEALAIYRALYEVSPQPALLYNQGRALEAMGEYAEALDMFEEFERRAPESLRSQTQGLEAHLKDLRTRIVTVVVRANVRGARVLLREKAVGNVDPELTLRTRAGAATVEILAQGYEPFRREVELVGGATVRVDATLVPLDRDAFLVVRTTPAADVTLDGRTLGRSPLELRVPAGNHVLSASARGHEDERVTMTLTALDRREVDLQLQKTPSITSRWWFWTGIAATVCAGTVLAIALTTEKDASRGTFQPGQLAAP